MISEKFSGLSAIIITYKSMKILRQKKMYLDARKRCSLLIPDFLFPYYKALKEGHGDLKTLLNFLIKKFYRNKARFYLRNEIATTIGYQEEGLDLHREDFRPIEWDWVELKLLASSHNMSICAFFVFLLRLEMAGALEINQKFGEVPPHSPKIILHQAITRYSIPRFTRLLYLRV